MAPYDYDDDLEEEKDYHESSDDDFNPTTLPADEPSSSSDEDAAAKPTQKRKRKLDTSEDLDSGDEVTIEAARKKRAKKSKTGKRGDDAELLLSDNEGGNGGLIKTRAQRRVEQKERKPLARTEGATIDVDALWAQMAAVPLKPPQTADSIPPRDLDVPQGQDDGLNGATTASAAEDEKDLVTIKKIYTFAGQRTTEEKQVPRSLLEQHISDGWKAAEPVVQEPDKDAEPKAKRSTIRRPLRRPSRFDANPTGYVRSLAPEHQLSWPRKATATTAADQEKTMASDAPKAARPDKAQKLNVVDKSRLDWTGFVVKEGIAEELDVHGKTKEAYLGRMQFLAGVEARREEERKKLKTATTAT